jgi:hypothetical protein
MHPAEYKLLFVLRDTFLRNWYTSCYHAIIKPGGNIAMRFGLFGFVMVFLTLAVLTIPAAQDPSKLYKWIDKNGTVWYTDDPAKLPKESQGEFEKLKTDEEATDAASHRTPHRPPVSRRPSSPSRDLSQRDWDRRLSEKKRLEEEISTLEMELTAARRALGKVPLTDRRGYWYVVDPTTGKRVHASYKDPGAIWSNQTWPELPREARTKESEERKRIESDITKMERDLNRAKEELSELARSL